MVNRVIQLPALVLEQGAGRCDIALGSILLRGVMFVMIQLPLGSKPAKPQPVLLCHVL